MYADTRSEQECTFLFFAANEVSITAIQLELWNQSLNIVFLKICIRIPGAYKSVLSFPLPPMKSVLQQSNWSFEIRPLPSNFSTILKFVSGYQGRTGVYFPFLFRQWSQHYSKPIGALKSGYIRYRYLLLHVPYPKRASALLHIYPCWVCVF